MIYSSFASTLILMRKNNASGSFWIEVPLR